AMKIAHARRSSADKFMTECSADTIVTPTIATTAYTRAPRRPPLSLIMREFPSATSCTKGREGSESDQVSKGRGKTRFLVFRMARPAAGDSLEVCHDNSESNTWAQAFTQSPEVRAIGTIGPGRPGGLLPRGSHRSRRAQSRHLARHVTS